MAGWPTVDRADDHELVAALRRAGKDAPARLYDAYAERLHDYACALTGDRDSAADSVHDALVTAQAGVERLKETTRLRPWLYALTRFQAAARMARADAAPGTPPPVFDEPEDPELAALVHEVLNELSRNEREVLQLSLRHGLTPAEVGAVLGLTSRQSAARLTRARDHLENAAAAVVLARTGRAHCPDLSAMVDSWEGPLTPMLRRRLSGHIGGCEVCTEGKQRQVAAAALLDMVPVAFPPISLRRRVVGTCLDPELEHTRTLILERGENFDRTGFPVNHHTDHHTDRHTDRRADRRAGRRTRRRRPRRLAPVLLAGVAVLAGTGAMALMGAEDGTPAAVRQAPTPTGSRAPMAIPTDEPPEEEPVEEPEETIQEPEETTPEPSATTRRPAPSATRPAGNPTPTRRPAPAAARLSIGCPDSITGAAKIGLRARNASVTWSAAVSAGMGVFPARGTLRAGGSASIWVTIDDPDAAGGGSVAFTSNGGTASCSLSWRGRQPTGEPTPSEDPTPTAEPTETPDQSATGDLVASK
ncbi:RNA polymerase sigma factor [Nonomuraea typhae]|uniref:RNA polymerase sigma factor n=1 Tax=Nonomuraea typhae TaxID=2603600 RepID=UPI0015E1D952|nr:sigma-70 family RNA polymerase sigma factor [Nonomuraea typhae]